MISLIIVFGIAYFFAMNIGASGAAAAMGVAYGSNAIKSRRVALVLCGIGIFLGAILGGSAVVETIGEGIIPSTLLNFKIVIIILSSATLSLFIANLIGIPLSTSEVTVGAVIGVGVAYQAIYLDSLLKIISFWIIIPVIAFLLGLLGGKLVKVLQKMIRNRFEKAFSIILIITGFLEAFSAGMNNVGNAIGPLVGAGYLSVNLGTITGGFFVAIGAILFGSRVIETNGKEITRLSKLEGIMISSTAALLIISASLLGIPVPLTQVTTCAILGIGTAQNGFNIWQKGIINRIIKVWVVSPVFSLVISYAMVRLFLEKDLYTTVVIFSVMIATIGSLSLANSIKKEKQAIQEQGGGI